MAGEQHPPRAGVLNSDWGKVQPGASEQTEIELAAHELLQRLDRTTA